MYRGDMIMELISSICVVDTSSVYDDNPPVAIWCHSTKNCPKSDYKYRGKFDYDCIRKV